MQIILLVSLFLVAINASPCGRIVNSELNDDWETYKIQYRKTYEFAEEIARKNIWKQNLKYIQQHNIEYDLGKHTYTLGLNEHADMTNDEFKTKYFGIKPRLTASNGSHFIAPENMGVLPVSVDWRTKGYVTPVKNQEQCGSCWAFSTTGSLEGQHFRKTGNLISLSEQQLVDCSGSFGNMGCNGGLMDDAFKYIKKYGIEAEKSYRYTAKDGTCRFSKSKVVATCTGYVDIKAGNEKDLASAVATVGPVSVAIDASQPSFQLYKNGIYNERQCSSVSLDHGVLAVGYGVEGGKNYWLVKNSWGKSWGISGYIKMSKDAKNQCGIATSASYPLV